MGSAGPYANLHLAPDITTPASHHSVFYRLGALPAPNQQCQSTEGMKAEACHSQSINQSIKVICNARNVVHKLESEARAVASGRVLMVIEKMGLEASFESV